MPVHHADFGKDIITLYGNDILFLDTNVVIAYLYTGDRYHKTCLTFIRYLLSQDVILCLSEIVVAETINGLARLLYAENQVQSIGGTANYHRSRWSSHVIKHDKESLAKYNELACEMLTPFLSLCYIATTDEKQILQGMQISHDYPLASADALIVSSALSLDALGIISLDRDMRQAQDLEIYTTNIDNTEFDPYSLISRMGIRFQNYLLSTLGESEYQRLFSNHISSQKT